VKAIEKYDICWEVYADCIPMDIQSMLIAGARVCDKCHRPLDATLRPQIALIHFQKSAFGNQQALPFLYSICSRECSRFILIASCILEVFFPPLHPFFLLVLIICSSPSPSQFLRRNTNLQQAGQAGQPGQPGQPGQAGDQGIEQDAQ